MSAIEVKNLVKKFHGQTVLHGIDLEVKPGEVVAIIGPSGSGKTTLLRSINLLEQPEAGTITVGDITIDTARSLSQQKSLIRQLRQHVGFVFQNLKKPVIHVVCLAVNSSALRLRVLWQCVLK